MGAKRPYVRKAPGTVPHTGVNYRICGDRDDNVMMMRMRRKIRRRSRIPLCSPLVPMIPSLPVPSVMAKLDPWLERNPPTPQPSSSSLALNPVRGETSRDPVVIEHKMKAFHCNLPADH